MDYIDFVLKYPTKAWNREALSMNRSFNRTLKQHSPPRIKMHIHLKFVEHHLEDIPWNWPQISKMSNLTPEFVEQHIDRPWDWDALSLNPMQGNPKRDAQERLTVYFDELMAVVWHPDRVLQWCVAHDDLSQMVYTWRLPSSSPAQQSVQIHSYQVGCSE
jgi:hypothetical protein